MIYIFDYICVFPVFCGIFVSFGGILIKVVLPGGWQRRSSSPGNWRKWENVCEVTRDVDGVFDGPDVFMKKKQSEPCKGV